MGAAHMSFPKVNQVFTGIARKGPRPENSAISSIRSSTCRAVRPAMRPRRRMLS